MESQQSNYQEKVEQHQEKLIFSNGFITIKRLVALGSTIHFNFVFTLIYKLKSSPVIKN